MDTYITISDTYCDIQDTIRFRIPYKPNLSYSIKQLDISYENEFDINSIQLIELTHCGNPISRHSIDLYIGVFKNIIHDTANKNITIPIKMLKNIMIPMGGDTDRDCPIFDILLKEGVPKDFKTTLTLSCDDCVIDHIYNAQFIDKSCNYCDDAYECVTYDYFERPTARVQCDKSHFLKNMVMAYVKNKSGDITTYNKDEFLTNYLSIVNENETIGMRLLVGVRFCQGGHIVMRHCY